MIYLTVWDWELMNDTKPIWRRKAKEVEDSEYNDFFKVFTKETEDPLAKIHFTAEGEPTFRSILFVPDKLPPTFYSDMNKAMDNRIKLYVRRIFITDDMDDLMPRYLSWLWGVVDSDDLPLNVSRETLQQHKLLKVIKKKLVRKALEMLKKLSVEDFDKVWKEFGNTLKFGILEDSGNKTRIAKLLRFFSSNHEEDLTSLEDYIERMRPKQEHIYYVAGKDREELEKSPFVERVLKKGYEVVYFVDAIDEYVVQSMPEYEGKKFQDVAKEGLTFSDEGSAAKQRLESQQEEYKPLTDWLKDTALTDVIEKATVSNRLIDSPCALVAAQWAWSANMERVAAAQAYKQPGADVYRNQKKTLELNPRHPVIIELLHRVESDSADHQAEELARILYDTAVLRSGYSLVDSSDFATRIDRMLRSNLNIDPDALVEPEPEPEPKLEDSEVESEGEESSDQEDGIGAGSDGELNEGMASHTHEDL